MLCTCVAWVYLVCLLLGKEKSSSPVSAITVMMEMGLYEVPLILLGFGMWIMLANFHMMWYYVGVMSSFQHARDECEFKRAYAF